MNSTCASLPAARWASARVWMSKASKEPQWCPFWSELWDVVNTVLQPLFLLGWYRKCENMCMMWVAHVSSTCNYFIFGHGDLKVLFDAVFCAQHFCFRMHSCLFDKNSPAPLTACPLLRSAKKNRLSGFVPFVQISQHLSTDAELPNSQPFRGVWLSLFGTLVEG